MKRIAFLLIAGILFSQPAWAARAKLSIISKDPYLSAVVVDADTGKVLFADHADTAAYPASVLKLMDLLVVLDSIKEGKVKLDDMVQVTREAAKTGGSQVYLDPREQFSVDDMLYALMVQSANDAAVALADHIGGSKEGFVALMNQKAAELGMKNTHFYSVHGLPPDEGQKPDVTTASDLAILCRALAARPEALKYTGTRERGFRNDTFIMRNHNHLLGQIEGCDGFKTGFYDAAGFSIAVTAKRGGVRIIAIVMGSKNRKVRDEKAAELLAKGFAMEPSKPVAASLVKTPAPAAVPAATAEPKAAPVNDNVKQEADAPAQKQQAAKASDSGWGKFFLGLGVGLVLFGGFVVIRSRKRDSNEKAKYIKHS